VTKVMRCGKAGGSVDGLAGAGDGENGRFPSPALSHYNGDRLIPLPMTALPAAPGIG
jgi:hypothetical protein